MNTIALVALLSIGCPMHDKHTAVDARHDTMGFSHAVSRHTFRLTPDGGAIELRAKNGSDRATVSAIRKHLREIARDFERGDFSTPEMIHAGTPDGVPVMLERRHHIRYRYENIDTGGRVRIVTRDEAARHAVHAFLRFQIDEHRTGDPGVVEQAN